jgi:hypothetical protein
MGAGVALEDVSVSTRRYRGAACATGLIALVAVAAASPTRGRDAGAAPAGSRASAVRPYAGSSAFRLFAGSRNVLLAANRVSCNVNNVGHTCVSPTGSAVYGGGSWPRGTGDQYIFNGGLQVAAIVPPDAGFAWAGDTVGAYFMDGRGDQQVGQALEGLFDSRRASDWIGWPAAATVRDTSLFDVSLIGRRAASDQDTWVRYWDGSLNSSGRQHAMGLVVDQRTLVFSRPWANRDIVYFIYRLINATSREPASYRGLEDAGYAEGELAQLADLGSRFQHTAEAADPALQVPDTGFSFSNLYVGYDQDPDIGNAGFNVSTAILPFAMGLAYKADFNEPTWEYPADAFSAPAFAQAPGLTGAAFLQSLKNPTSGSAYGITIWTSYGDAPPFTYPIGTSQLYRYLAGSPSPATGDGSCYVPDPLSRHVCYPIQAPVDAHYMQSTGPVTLRPGEGATVVMALVFAAPVDTEPASGSGTYALPAFSLAPYVTPGIGTMAPGYPATAESLAALGSVQVRPVERAAGWAGFSDANGDGRIEPEEVRTVPYSLLHKAQVAQAVFQSRFLVPEAPEPPVFFAVPGDGKVTIAWQKSITEVAGDPYFAVASQPTSPLYDPDYRQFDVEGYRVWRGRSAGDLRLVAQFDHEGTVFTDYTGQFWYGSQCAPELGITAACPSFPNPVPLAGNVIQVPPGGRVRLANGSIALFRSDTAVTGGASGLPSLTDTSVPFVFVDQPLQNGFAYFYSVTAFDVNSIASGYSSLESPMVVKAATPRAASSNAQGAQLVTGVFGGDGTPLQPTAPWPAIDPATGTFGGPIPPANGASIRLLAGIPEAMPPGDYAVRVDSIGPGFVAAFFATYPRLYLTVMGGEDTLTSVFSLSVPAYGAPTALDSVTATLRLVPYDSSRARLLGLAFTQDVRMLTRFSWLVTPLSANGVGNALIAGRYGVPGDAAGEASRYLLHSRWFDEGGTEPPQPTIDPYGSASRTNGALTGVSLIYSPLAYRVEVGTSIASHQINASARGVQYAAASWYPADIVVTWGAGGALTVRDSTHRTDLPFKKSLQVGWGFVNERAFGPAGIAAGDLDDGTGAVQIGVAGYHHLYGLYPVCNAEWWGIHCAPLESTAELEPVDWTNDGAPDGAGIMLVVNGEPFIMAMNALPAAGTKWHLRAVGGNGLTATCTPGLPSSLGAVPTSCRGYDYTPAAVRPAYAPGLEVRLRVTRGFEITAAAGDLSRVHTVPDPYYYVSAYETTVPDRQLHFVNLPDRAIVRIYSSSGILVTILQHDDPTGGGEEPWNLESRNGHHVASGVYFFHVEAPDGTSHVGRFTIVNRR